MNPSTLSKVKIVLSLLVNFFALILMLIPFIGGFAGMADSTLQSYLLSVEVFLLIYFGLRYFIRANYHSSYSKIYPIVDLSSLVVYTVFYLSLANFTTKTNTYDVNLLRGLVYFDAGLPSLVYLPLIFLNTKDIYEERLKKIWSYIGLGALVIPVMVFVLLTTLTRVGNAFRFELNYTQVLIIPAIIVSVYLFIKLRIPPKRVTLTDEFRINSIRQTLKTLNYSGFGFTIISLLCFLSFTLFIKDEYARDSVIHFANTLGVMSIVLFLAALGFYIAGSRISEKYMIKGNLTLLSASLIFSLMIAQLFLYLKYFSFTAHHPNTYYLDILGLSIIYALIFKEFIRQALNNKNSVKLVFLVFLSMLLLLTAITFFSIAYVFLTTYILSIVDFPLIVSQVIAYVFFLFIASSAMYEYLENYKYFYASIRSDNN